MNNQTRLWKIIKDFDNVKGYSKKLRRRARKGKLVDEEVFRVYVSKKLPLKEIRLGNRIPSEIEGIPTDVWQIGEVVIPPLMGVVPFEYTQRERPLLAGVSIGNEAITAGTLGWFFKKNGEVGIGSNAHILSEDPLKNGSHEKDILQPGRYDGGTSSKDIVAEYRWHKQLYGGVSECPVSNLVAWFGNGISSLFDARTRFRLVTEGDNKIDFAVTYKPRVDYEIKIYGAEEWDGFVGLGFAGSDQASFFCKTRNILETGWAPVGVKTKETSTGDIIHKIGRTSEYTKGKVLDDCAHVIVDYGNYNYIELDDLIMTEPMIEGGDSGSSAWTSMVVKEES